MTTIQSIKIIWRHRKSRETIPLIYAYTMSLSGPEQRQLFMQGFLYLAYTVLILLHLLHSWQAQFSCRDTDFVWDSANNQNQITNWKQSLIVVWHTYVHKLWTFYKNPELNPKSRKNSWKKRYTGVILYQDGQRCKKSQYSNLKMSAAADTEFVHFLQCIKKKFHHNPHQVTLTSPQPRRPGNSQFPWEGNS